MAAVCCCAGSLLWGGEMTFCEKYCSRGGEPELEAAEHKGLWSRAVVVEV